MCLQELPEHGVLSGVYGLASMPPSYLGSDAANEHYLLKSQ
jgi:hypothetical protein